MAQNGILQYDKSTGLKVGTKAEIRQDLQDMWVTAYGGDMVVAEGTSTYTFIDMLSSLLADMGNAAKELYDSFTFATAGTYSYGKDSNGKELTGAPLDMLCSLTGISRREGESDVELRYRYYASLYNQSVGTSEGLRSQILKLVLNNYDDNTFVVKDAYIYNNTAAYVSESSTGAKIVEHPVDTTDTSGEKSSIGTITIPNHSILPVIRIEVNNDLYTACTTHVLLNDQGESSDRTHNDSIINTCVADYKSLGCGIYNPTTDSSPVFHNYDLGYCIIASAVKCRLKVDATIVIKDNVLSNTIPSEVNQAIIVAIQQQLDDYLSHFTLGQSLVFGDIARQCYIATDNLGYSQYIINVTDIGYELYVGDSPTSDNFTTLTTGVKIIPYTNFIIPDKADKEYTNTAITVVISTPTQNSTGQV